MISRWPRSFFGVNQVDMRLKQVCVVLQNGAIQLEWNVMQFMEGNIELHTTIGGFAGFATKMQTNALTQRHP